MNYVSEDSLDPDSFIGGFNRHRLLGRVALIFAGVDVGAAIVTALLWIRYPNSWMSAFSFIVLSAPLVAATVIALTKPPTPMRNLATYTYLVATVLATVILYIARSSL